LNFEIVPVHGLPVATRARRAMADPMAQSQTYALGTDEGDLALRAREIGVRHRAAQNFRNRRLLRPSPAGMLITLERLSIAALRSYDDDDADDAASVASVDSLAQPTQQRSPSWLEEAMSEPSGVSPLVIVGEPVEPADDGFSLLQAFFATVKSVCGPAVLYIPKGFQEGGVVFSPLMLLFSYALFGWGAARLLEAWAAHRKSYAGLMGAAFGRRGVALVRFTIVAQQSGICLTYFIFVATNLQQLACYARPVAEPPSLKALCVLQSVIYAPLCCIRNVQNFAHTNLAANALILYALVVLASFAGAAVSRDAADVGMPSLPYFEPSTFYLFVGTSAFVYEGSAALLVPLQEAVKRSRQHAFPAMYIQTCGGIIVTYIFFGTLNWAAYGAATQTVLTVNLPSGRWKASVQLAYTAAVVLTFPLQMFPAIQILKKSAWRPIAKACCGSARMRRDAAYSVVPESPLEERRWASSVNGTVGRCGLVVALSFCAVAVVSSLDKLVALIGGCLGIPLAFVFPLAIHLKLMPDAPRAVRRFNKVAMAVGITLAVACSGVTLATW